MLLNVNGNSLVIDFRHENINNGFNNGATFCTFGVEGCSPHVSGVTLCSLSDNYSRRVGRKLALLRAMQQHPLTKDDKPLRTAIWQEFFARCKM